ncbi:hypothetical protein AB833_08600 [Chromatiales bacterium (ex Bugula neritina AB1)]|nr:hypothetical protein AB833_08600 [Chromatiales bacterium (ex Bugula neritina AB1)]
MSISSGYYRSAFDAIPEQIAIVARDGAIKCVNRAWVDSASKHGCSIKNWEQINYLAVCDRATESGCQFSRISANGLRSLVSGEVGSFQHEYRCLFTDGEQWFSVTMKPVDTDDDQHYLISHHNITSGRLANKTLEILSRTDSLTGLSNRRHLDEKLSSEWRRDMRLGTPLSIIMLDIDRFKTINDSFGHLIGDECLRKTSRVIQTFAKRPGDLAARFGGDEFILVLGNTTADKALQIATRLHQQIAQIELEETLITASIGVATLTPGKGTTEQTIVAAADQALYTAKISGRNRVVAYENSITA